jgi:hypothetical protein
LAYIKEILSRHILCCQIRWISTKESGSEFPHMLYSKGDRVVPNSLGFGGDLVPVAKLIEAVLDEPANHIHSRLMLR